MNSSRGVGGLTSFPELFNENFCDVAPLILGMSTGLNVPYVASQSLSSKSQKQN